MADSSRPLSPHLSVYRWQITLAMSIAHRITGIGLYGGMGFLVWFLVAAAWGDGALEIFQAVAGSWFGQLVLIGFTWALFHHLLGGLRHFVWDMGEGFSREVRFGMGWATLIGGLVLTALVWIFGVWM